MSNLISRKAAIEAIERNAYRHTYLDQIINIISNLPSAERKKGEWILKPNIYGVAYCSECDYELHTDNTNFCPNCGADMRGEEDGCNTGI